MPAPKLNFIPERNLKNEYNEYTPATVSLQYNNTSKSVNLMFMLETIKTYDLNKKYIRLYGDRANRTIGWSIVSGDTDLDTLNDCRYLEQLASTGYIQTGITKLLKSLGITLTRSLSKLPVKKYHNVLQTYAIYYVEIPHEEVKLEEKKD